MARAARSGSRADTALVSVCALLALLATVLPLPIRDAIASSLRRTVVAPLLALQERAERGRTAFAEREAVTTQLDSLALRNAELGTLEQENQQLRGLLHLSRQLQWGFVAAEALHGQGSGDDHTLLLTRGSNAGVRVRAGVVAPAGLVGQVTTADPGSSVAILWTHPDFRASAMAADGSAFGIVRPHLGEEPGRFLLEMRGVAFRDALKPGTLVTTSGLGGVYPRGIPIGVVLNELKQTNEVWSRAYLVRPAVYPPDVSNVMILAPQRTADGGLDSAWIGVQRAEAAARALAASGDSLARLQAAATAYRQRQIDSLKAVMGIARDDSLAGDSLRAKGDTSRARGDSVRARSDTSARREPAPGPR